MDAYAHVTCPSCGFQLQAQDMNLASMAATCRVCHALVDLRAVLPGRASESATGDPAIPAPLSVPRPAAFTVDDNRRTLRIERRWFTPMVFVIAVFAIVWNGFLAFWYAMAWKSGNVAMLLFPALHVTVGIGLVYLAVAGFLNRTLILVDRGLLTVKHVPLPWPRPRDLSTADIEQVYCREHVSRSSKSTSVRYSVQVRTRDGRSVKLVTGLYDRDHALFVEQEIERHLGIVNRPVASEMRR